MRVTITKPHDIVTKRNASGASLSTVAYKPTTDPITVKRDHGEELIAAGAAVEVVERAKRPAGGAVDSSKFNTVEVGKEVFEPFNGD